ncbi:MAG: YceI family protein [Bacteroidetes bacterium]|nr:YceI family protein [Bacteroidota bacterium]
MKTILVCIMATVAGLIGNMAGAQPVFLGTTDTVSFFSSTPVADIDARSVQAVGAINQSTKDIFFKVPMKSFVFKKALMQEHFNENYVESDKFPNATFKGKITDDVDLTKDGTYSVTVSGDFTVHGVSKPKTVPGTVTVKGNNMYVKASFDVKLADHDIAIPTIVSQEIAEVVNVKVSGMLTASPK